MMYRIYTPPPPQPLKTIIIPAPKDITKHWSGLLQLGQYVQCK